MYKYKFRFLYLYSIFGEDIVYKGDMVKPMMNLLNKDEANAGGVIVEIQRKNYLRYVHRSEAEYRKVDYDGRRSYFTIGESGYKFLKSFGITSKDDPKLSSLLAKEMLKYDKG